jgi:hypothetical protein
MSTVKRTKIVAFISIILVLALSFLLFSNLKLAFSLAPVNGKVQVSSYLYLLADVILSIFLFTLIFIVLNKNNSAPAKETLGDKLNFEDNQELKPEQKQEQTIDIEHFKKIIMPNVDESLTLNKLADKILSNFSKEFPIVTALIYFRAEKEGEFKAVGEYAYFSEEKPKDFKEGETLPGQVAKNKILLNISNIPDNYIKVGSGLGKGSPKHLLFIPILHEEETIAILELASFKKFEKNTEDIFNHLSPVIAEALLKYNQKVNEAAI